MNYEEKVREILELMPKLHGPIKSDEVNRYTQGERCLLVTLYENGGTLLPSELAKLLNVSAPRVASILNLAEEKGLIIRENVSGDRRKVCVILTEKGIQEVLDGKKKVWELMNSYVRMLGEEDTENLIRIMKKTDAYFMSDEKDYLNKKK